MVQAGAKRNAAEQQQEDTIYETQLQAATAVSAIIEAPCLLHVRRPFCVLVQSEARYMSSQLQQMSGQLTLHDISVRIAVDTCRCIANPPCAESQTC